MRSEAVGFGASTWSVLKVSSGAVSPTRILRSSPRSGALSAFRIGTAAGHAVPDLERAVFGGSDLAS